SRARFAATSLSRCPTISCTAPTRPRRPRQRARSGSAMSSPDRPEYVSPNVETCTRINAEFTGPNARAAWAKEGLASGVFGHAEARRDILGAVAGLDGVEFGCGTAYVSAWFARNGARPVGVDPTPAQLATARRMQEEFDLEFPLVEAAA